MLFIYLSAPYLVIFIYLLTPYLPIYLFIDIYLFISTIFGYLFIY